MSPTLYHNTFRFYSNNYRSIAPVLLVQAPSEHNYEFYQPPLNQVPLSSGFQKLTADYRHVQVQVRYR